MDSGNNGSMQSSSGDEEYDSRSESATAPIFFNSHNNFGNYQNQQPPPPTTFFSSNNYLHALSQSQIHSSSNPSSFLNHQGPINHGSFSSLSSSSIQPLQRSQLLNDQTNVGVKTPKKKRARTSRRAPTTVLTTDTSNFRAMVQEFTGIPEKPFSFGPSYPRRLDLFNNYPLRPTTQKFQPPIPFVSDAITTSISATKSHNNNNYQLLSDLGFNNKEPQNMLNNFIQQNLNPITFGASNFGVSSFDQDNHHLGMSYAHVGLPNQQDHMRSLEGNLGN